MTNKDMTIGQALKVLQDKGYTLKEIFEALAAIGKQERQKPTSTKDTVK